MLLTEIEVMESASRKIREDLESKLEFIQLKLETEGIGDKSLETYALAQSNKQARIALIRDLLEEWFRL